MAYYLRKIARAKWPDISEEWDMNEMEKEVKNVSSDAITGCIRTTGKKLSLWRVEEIGNNVEDIVPLIVGFESPDSCDIVYISEDDILNEGLELKQSPEDANVCIERLKSTHYNAEVNNYEELGKFAKIILKSLESHVRFKRKDVKNKLKELLECNEINEDMISPKLYDKIS